MTHKIAIILIAVALLILPSSAHSQKFVHAYSSISTLNATFWIIQDVGFAKQEGLDTELVYIPSSSTVAQATLAGEVVISPANGQVIADVGLQGGDLVAMGGITASVEDVGSSNVIVYMPSGSPVSSVVPPNVYTPRFVHCVDTFH